MNDDLISREALKEKITRRMCYAPISEKAKKIIITAILSDIDEEQTVEHSLLPLASDLDSAYMRGYEVGKAEGILKANTRPQGEWKLHGMIYYCSNCGHDCGESGDNFCGNCGADMRGVLNG